MDAQKIEDIVGRAEALDFPAEPLGLQVADAATWRAVLAVAPRERVVAIVAGLDEIDRRRVEEQDDEARRHRAAVLEGREQPTSEEEAAANQERIEAEVEHQDFIARRPERIEALLERIVSALEKK